MLELRKPTLQSRAGQIRGLGKRQRFQPPLRALALNSLSRKSKR